MRRRLSRSAKFRARPARRSTELCSDTRADVVVAFIADAVRQSLRYRAGGLVLPTVDSRHAGLDRSGPTRAVLASVGGRCGAVRDQSSIVFARAVENSNR